LITNDGQIKDTSRQHNHEPKPPSNVVSNVVDEEADEGLMSNTGNPNRHLVPEDLQSLIISCNPERDIKFTTQVGSKDEHTNGD